MQYFAYSQKAFVYKYVVMLSDTDQFKHMSFANYLKLMFLASDALFVSFYTEDFLEINRIQMVNSRMQFKRQTMTGDDILIKVNSTNIGDSDFVLLYTFVIEGTGELVGLGRQSYEVVDRTRKKLCSMPAGIKNFLIPINVDEKHLVYTY